MEIELNQGEIAVAKWLAKKRYESNRAKGIVDRKMGDQSAEFTDLNGVGAEMVFCKLFNLYPDFDLVPGKHDAVTRKGATVDVKATKYRNGKLLAVTSKKLEASDVYVLVIGEFPKYRVVGYAKAEDLLNESQIKDLGRGPTYAMEQSELRSFAQ